MPFSSFSALYIQTRGCHILRSSTRNLRRVGIRTMTSLTNNDKNKNNKVIIDTDAGVDDAQALMIALTQHRLEKINVIGITTVTGNVKLQRVIQNVARVQHTMNTNVPIFNGADFPMLGRSGVNASYWHGTDGLGDSGFENIGTEDILIYMSKRIIIFLKCEIIYIYEDVDVKGTLSFRSITTSKTIQTLNLNMWFDRCCCSCCCRAVAKVQFSFSFSFLYVSQYLQPLCLTPRVYARSLFQTLRVYA